MNSKDQITIGSQSILWVAGVGVGLLTLAFVMGVQVGKQSAALRRPAVRSGEDDLRDLPEPLVDQLKVFEGDGPDKLVPTPRVDPTAPRPTPKPEATDPAQAPAAAPGPGDRWTLQLVATPDATEARKVAERAKAAGFTTTTVKEKGQVKVRTARPTDRATADRTAEKLKKAGFKPFAVKE